MDDTTTNNTTTTSEDDVQFTPQQQEEETTSPVDESSSLKRSAPDDEEDKKDTDNIDDRNDEAGPRRKRPNTTEHSSFSDSHSRPSQFELNMLVPAKRAGSIIGKGGATIKALREKSGAFVRVNNSFDQVDRSVVATGSLEQLEVVFKLIMAKLKEADEAAANGTNPSMLPVLAPELDDKEHTEVKLLAPNSKIGGLIGKAGSTINSLRDATGASITIPRNMVMPMPGMGDVDRAVTVAGDLAQVVHAMRVIVEKLSEIKPSFKGMMGGGPGGPGMMGGGPGGRMMMGGGRPPAMGGYGGGHHGGMGGGRGGPPPPGGPPRGGGMMGGGGPPPPGPNGPQGGWYGGGPGMGGGPGGMGGGGGGGYNDMPSESESVSVPSECIGKVIGKKGSTINMIRQQCACKIDIHDSDDPNAKFRVITITGNPEQRQAAKYMISTNLY